ncbi:MAG TPA: glycosyltransferase family 4 protein, partial [Woeseiaceae bacterium]
RFVLDLCRYLSDHADIKVLAPHTAGAEPEEVVEGVRVRRFRYFIEPWQSIAYQGGMAAKIRARPIRVVQLPFFFAALWWSTFRSVREWKPDVIHAHWIIPQGLAACLAVGGRLPILCTSHGGDLQYLKSTFLQRVKAWALRRCRRITVVSRSMLPEVEALAPRVPVDVIPMGTDLSTQFVPPERSQERDEDEIIFVGRLVETKGIRYLLDAFSVLHQKMPRVKLTIVGDGPSRQDLTEHARRLGIVDRITFLGGLPHRDLPALYQRAAAAVFPFVQEGFGLVVVEAMGCGCPVIVSDIPAMQETVVPDVTGIVTPPEDPEALARSIERCLCDESLRSRLAGSGLAAVRDRFDWSSITRAYLQVIHDCMQVERTAI